VARATTPAHAAQVSTIARNATMAAAAFRPVERANTRRVQASAAVAFAKAGRTDETFASKPCEAYVESKKSRDNLRTFLGLMGIALDTIDGIEEGDHPLDALHSAWKTKNEVEKIKETKVITVMNMPVSAPGKTKGVKGIRTKGRCVAHKKLKTLCPECFAEDKKKQNRE
jgi:hypothetical protein